MIVADTNVLSEPLRPDPDRHVLEWLQAHQDDLSITSISAGELLHGALRLPDGRRRRELLAAIEALLDSAADRLLDFDGAAARAYAVVRAEREAAGRPSSVEDLMISGICRSRGVDLATRNVRDFEGLGIRLHDPWLVTPG